MRLTFESIRELILGKDVRRKNIGEGSTSLLVPKRGAGNRIMVDTEEKDQSQGREDSQEAKRKSYAGTIMK